ncbi:MAG TPA: hypothetical protein EYQ61_10620 [Dehalococcoidia bacterium]|jgi:hypothetical protein|nr:hypothetical protein [Dehalococcoidia bacterium]HIK88511.1 hypothetical protein [Dehalococcoidia bacterium]
MSHVTFPVDGENQFKIEPISLKHLEIARARQKTLTKPAVSLGRLEDIAYQLAGIQRKNKPAIEDKWVVIAAADHGVVEEGVSAFPQAVGELNNLLPPSLGGRDKNYPAARVSYSANPHQPCRKNANCTRKGESLHHYLAAIALDGLACDVAGFFGG